jgi:DNA-binding MarR family transcriptional regulator
LTETDPTPDLIVTAARQYREKFDWADVKSIELVLRLAATATSIRGAAQRLFSAHGFERAAGRMGVLRVLYFSPKGRMNQNEISNEMQVTSANISYVLEGLERDGLVTRTPHETDRRVTWVQLTEDGEEVFKRLAPAMTAHLVNLGSGFTDDEKVIFSSFLERLRNNAESAQR